VTIKLLNKIKDFIGLQRCKIAHKHKFVIISEPTAMLTIDNNRPIFFNKDGLRYCQYCKQLELFDYHCLGLNPPVYIVDETKKIDYNSIIGDLVEDPYNLPPEDLQLIKIVKPELYEYCKLYANKGENNEQTR